MAKSADSAVVAEIRRLALNPDNVEVRHTAKSDMMAHGLTADDVCDTIVEWIDAGERVKPTTIHTIPDLMGMSAYEMKPRINHVLFYIKITLMELGNQGEHLLLVSVHPDH